MNITSIAPANISLFSRIARAFAQRMQDWADAIDAGELTDRHRMGAWEINGSPSAQAALQVMRARSAQHDAGITAPATQNLTNTALSENG
jgi:hypothetical protein